MLDVPRIVALEQNILENKLAAHSEYEPAGSIMIPTNIVRSLVNHGILFLLQLKQNFTHRLLRHPTPTVPVSFAGRATI